MRRWLIVLFVVAAVGLLWFRQRERRAAELQRSLDARRQLDAARAAERQLLTTGGAPAAGAAATMTGSGAGSGPLQEAADAAMGRDYQAAASRMREQSAELAAARQAAERAADTLAREADAALAAVQAAAAAYGGAVPGDGTADCPAGYPVKGDVPARQFVEPGQLVYDGTTPDICFQSAAAAEAAGFSRIETGAVGDMAGVNGGAAGIVAGAAMRDREIGNADVVAEAIEAAGAESVPPGAVCGDGGRECPPSYPIKGNQSSMLYHEPSSRSYTVTIPEFCFSTVEAAEAAGFSAPRR